MYFLTHWGDSKLHNNSSSLQLTEDVFESRHSSSDHHHHYLSLQPFVGFRLLSQVSPSSSILSCLLLVLTFSFFRSSITSSCHRCLGLPIGLVPMGPQSNSFLVVPAWSIRWIWPSHLILCALMNLTISAASINLSIYMLFRILHILSILTGPNIFLNICFSKESCHSLIKTLWPPSPRRQFIDNELTL